MKSRRGRVALDGNSSIQAVVSTRDQTSTEQGSVIHHRLPENDEASSLRTKSYRGHDMASVRDREVIGSGVGSEVAEMV